MKTIKTLWMAWLLAAPAFAGFRELSPSPAADSRGGAGVARAEGAAALFLNPAAAARADQSEASFSYASLLTGMGGISHTQEAFSLVRPMGRKGGVGVAVAQFDADGKLREQQGTLSGSWRLTETFSAGVGATFLKHAYGIGSDPRAQLDPVFRKGTSKSGVGLDAGLVWGTRAFSLGASVRNVNQPDLGIASVDKVPREARAGVAASRGRLGLVADALSRDAGDVADGKETSFGAGVDFALAPSLSLRAGARSNGSFGMGLGLTLGSFGLDYAARLGGDLGQPGHRAAISYRWGPSRVAPAPHPKYAPRGNNVRKRPPLSATPKKKISVMGGAGKKKPFISVD